VIFADLRRYVRSAHTQARGFTLIELVVVAAVLALLVALALPSYLGARNKAAVDEANYMAQEWRSLVYGCYLRFISGTACASDAAIGFQEQPGKYWNWTPSASANGGPDVYNLSATAGTLTVSWPSLNNGLENNETYVVTVFLTGSNTGQATGSCIPNGC